MLKQTAIALALVGVSSVALAGNFQVKVGGSVVAPTQDTKINPTTVVEADSEVAFTPSVEYFFGQSGVSTEVLLATPISHDVTVNGANAVKLKHLPPTVTVKYNFNQDGRFNPYIGVGGVALIPWEEETQGPLAGTKAKVKEDFGVAGQIGFNYKPADAKNWGVFVDARYLQLDPKVSIKTATGAPAVPDFKLDIDPMVYTLGYSYRF